MSALARGWFWQRFIKALLCASVLFCIFTSVRAEKWVEVNGYQIHYNAVYSMDLSLRPEEVRSIKLPRGRHYSWVIISVRQKEGAIDRDVSADVQGDAVNLLGQRVELDFRHIKEKGGQYYIAPLRIGDEDVFRFSIGVKPESSSVQEIIQFQQRYRVDKSL